MKKKDIERMIQEECLASGHSIRIKKHQLTLKEEDINGNDGIYVEPKEGSTGSKEGISTALSNAVNNNPTEHDFKVDTNNFNGSAADDKVNIDIKAKNAFDAEKQIRNKMTNPALQSLTNSNKAMMNVHIADSKTADDTLSEGRKFKKKDFDKFIRKF